MQYTINFWADYFSLSPPTIRNIVNYVAFPVIDQKTKKVIDILSFVDTELQRQIKLLGSEIDRDTYFQYLESDHNKRMLQEYGEELGYFGEMADK